MITFSVITITYNAEACLRRTLDSVLAQTYPDVEHIIVDGASKDGTLDIAKEYREQNEVRKTQHKVIIQSEPDKGLYDAMNKGLKMATGDYIVYMNAGDSFPEADTLINIYKSLPCPAVPQSSSSLRVLPAVIYGDTDLTDNDGNVIGRRRLSPPEHLDWKSFRHGMLVCHQAFYARTDIARLYLYDLRYRHSADVDWCIKVMKEAERRGLPLHNTHLVLANYQKEGQTTEYHRASLFERFDVMRHHYGLFSTVMMHVWFVLRAVLKR